jgi:hypothetical protein
LKRLYFSGPDVNATLSGEASFEVLTGYHVTVEYNQVIIKATGASFSITEVKGTIEVTALEGKIAVCCIKGLSTSPPYSFLYLSTI